MTVSIVKPGNEQPLDDKGRPTPKHFQWLQLMTDLEPMIGTGSPEDVEEARAPRFYVDSAAATGSILYVKQVDSIGGDRKKGWMLV